MKNFQTLIFLLLCIFITSIAQADDGMWLPHQMRH